MLHAAPHLLNTSSQRNSPGRVSALRKARQLSLQAVRSAVSSPAHGDGRNRGSSSEPLPERRCMHRARRAALASGISFNRLLQRYSLRKIFSKAKTHEDDSSSPKPKKSLGKRLWSIT